MTHYIASQWVESGATLQSTNPATNETIWQGHQADAAMVNKAIDAAREAFANWSATSFEQRLEYLKAFTARIESSKAELAELIAKETGKVLWDAMGEAGAVIGKLNFAEKAYHERTGERHQDMSGFSAHLRHRPHGVMAVFGPYNFPAHLPNGHIIPALMAGNTIIFKPSEQTPAVGEWLVKQWAAVGLPSGVINLVQGEKETGIALASGAIDGLLFTGSSQTGVILHKQLAGRPELLLALEMGGNNPLIINQLDDVKAAAYETIQSAFITSGQRCTCARRLILVKNDQTQELIDTLVSMTQSIQVGAYTDNPEPFMGPVINAHTAQQLFQAHADLVAKGATPLVAMDKPDDGSAFVTPSILDVTGIKGIIDEEWFGPILKLVTVDSLDDAILEANNTQYGLSAGLFSNNRKDYEQCLLRLRAGIINWNKQTTGASGMAPFGGIGCSGNHHAAGYYSADYCAYPVASMESETLTLPETLAKGISL
ncbi:MAG: succinylglutamate-semialdehyde dehydrogenase [Rickettsiales bacterium]|nr:succinylglutamate-semialdehyde dehydrogenase [Rickettsiales bacterium]